MGQETVVDVIIGQRDVQARGLSRESEACLRKGLGSFDLTAWKLQANRDGTWGIDLISLFRPTIASCLTNEEVGVVVQTSIVWRDLAGTLSAAEADCVRDRIGVANSEALLDQPVLGRDAPLTDLPLDCLEEETAAYVVLVAIYVTSIRGEPVFGIPVAQTRCVLENVDLDQLFGAMSGPDAAQEDPGAALALLPALSECRIDLAALMKDKATPS